MRPDYTVDQDYASYSDADQDRWRRLYARQMRLVPGRACPEFLRVIETLGYDSGVPRFDEVNERLVRATRWRVVGVPGLLPEQAFFGHLAERRFPVTVWLREESEFDYIVEPDIFHDFFGHVPLLFDPVFADFMQAYGRGGLKADGLHALEYLARLYWYTVEFGLVSTPEGLRVYGAGILSSPGEVEYAVASAEPRRIGFDLKRVMRTRYKIDTFQQSYFVIEDFGQLFRETAPDFTPLYQEIADQPQLPADTLLPGDRVFN
jgi:phenylalanine-4-hydroxylase